MTRDEFRKKLATADGRAELGLTITGDDAAAILADDALLDQLYAKAQQSPPLGPVAPAVEAPQQPIPAAPAVQTGSTEPLPRLSRSEKVALSIVGAVVVVGVIIGVAISASHSDAPASADDESSSSSEPYVAPTPEREYPLLDGYRDAGNGLEWRFGDNQAYGGCDYYDKCSIVVLQAFKSCPGGVYVEANVLDTGGAVVGMTNGTVAALSANQEAHVRLGVTEQDGSKVQLTKITCNQW